MVDRRRNYDPPLVITETHHVTEDVAGVLAFILEAEAKGCRVVQIVMVGKKSWLVVFEIDL